MESMRASCGLLGGRQSERSRGSKSWRGVEGRSRPLMMTIATTVYKYVAPFRGGCTIVGLANAKALVPVEPPY